MHNKKIFMLLFSVILILSLFNSKVYANKINVVVNGTPITFDVAPVNENGRVVVPLRAIFESLGYEVKWDEKYQIATAELTEGSVKRTAYLHLQFLLLHVVEKTYATNDLAHENPIKTIKFTIPLDPKDSPTKIVNGRILLPTRAISEALGCKVEWQGNTQTVLIDTKNSKIIPPENWVDKAVAHCKTYAPSQLGLENSWRDDDTQNKSIIGKENTINVPNKIDENENAQKTYSVYDKNWNRSFEYQFRFPQVLNEAPKVGSVPAKILLNEYLSHELFFQDTKNENNYIRNVTDHYYGGFTYGGCNWYAGGRFWEVFGVPFPHFTNFLGTEKYLDIAAQLQEFTVIRNLDQVVPNSMAVFIPDTPTSTAHVLFIEYVVYDGNQNPIEVYFTEGNSNGDTSYTHGVDGAIKKLSYEKFILRGNTTTRQRCIGYITPNYEFYGY